MTRKVVFFVTFCSAAWRVFGGEHPLIATILIFLREARATLYVHEGDVESLREMVAAMTPGSAPSK